MSDVARGGRANSAQAADHMQTDAKACDDSDQAGIIELPLSAEADEGKSPQARQAAAREEAGSSSADSDNRNRDVTDSDAGIDAGGERRSTEHATDTAAGGSDGQIDAGGEPRAPEHATDTAAGGSDGDATDSEDAAGGDCHDLLGEEPNPERPLGRGPEAAGGDGAAAAVVSNEADVASPTAPRSDDGLVGGDVPQPPQAAAAGSSPLASRPASFGEVKPSWTELQREGAVDFAVGDAELLDLTLDDDDNDYE
jgi:hypothetical protein